MLKSLNYKHLSDIKKLATQTIWYGLPTILTRFVGLTLSIVVLRLYPKDLTGEFQLIYVIIPILMILYTYGLETSYFNFAIKVDKSKLFNTTFSNIIITSIIFSIVVHILAGDIASWLGMPHQKAMVQWMAAILFIDTLSALPYAKLRQEERPRKFAFIKMVMVLVHFTLVMLIYHVWIPYLKTDPQGFLHSLYNGNDLLYFLIANFIGSTVAFFMLSSEWKGFRPGIDRALMQRILKYSLPLVLIGVIGMSNESIGRIIFDKFLKLPAETIAGMRGVLLTIYKLATLISVFTQMFRIAAEPFFFSKSVDKNAKETYAQSLILYLIISSIAFILVVFFKDIWLDIFTGKMKEQYLEGLYILPLLALNLMLTGIYYTMTVWYKLTDNNMKGAQIAFVGLVANVGFLILLVTELTYLGVAIAAVVSNIVMIVLSYLWGQKYYRIPYNIPKVLANFIILALIYLLLFPLQTATDSPLWSFIIGVAAMVLYLAYIIWSEPNMLSRIPILKKVK